MFIRSFFGDHVIICTEKIIIIIILLVFIFTVYLSASVPSRALLVQHFLTDFWMPEIFRIFPCVPWPLCYSLQIRIMQMSSICEVTQSINCSVSPLGTQQNLPRLILSQISSGKHLYTADFHKSVTELAGSFAVPLILPLLSSLPKLWYECLIDVDYTQM